MKNGLLLFVFSCFIGVVGLSQTSGFLGKRLYIDVMGTANIPLVSGSFNEVNYYRKGKTDMVGRRDLFDYGGGFQFSTPVSKRYMVGLSILFHQNEVFADRKLTSRFFNPFSGGYERTTSFRMESAQVFSMTLMPLTILSGKGSYHGIGITYDFGIGYSVARIREKSYFYALNEFDEDLDLWTDRDLYRLDANWPALHGISARYGIHLQLPIVSDIHFKIGAINQFTFYSKPDFLLLDNKIEGLFNFEQLFFNIRRENFFNWNLNTGIVFLL